MTKTQLSISIEYTLFAYIDELSKRYFGRNRSAALEYVIKSSMKKGIFEKFMAKHHASQLALYQERLEQIRSSKEEIVEVVL